MKFARLSSALQNYEQKSTLSVENVLGLIQDLCRDVKSSTGSTVDRCTVADPDAAVSRIIWLSSLVGRIYESSRPAIGKSFAHERAAELQSGVQDIERQCENMKQELNRLNTQTVELRGKREALEQARGSKVAELRELQNKYDLLQEESGQIEAQACQLAQHLQEGECRRRELKTEIAGLGEQYEQMKRELLELTDELELQRQSNQTYRGETLDGVRQALEQAQREGDVFAEVYAAHKEEYDTCCTRNQELLKSAQALETECKQLDSAYEVAQHRKQKRQEQLEMDRKRLCALEKELQELTETVTAQERAVRVVAVENNRLQLVVLPDVQTKLKEALVLKDKLQTQKSEAQAALQEIEDALALTLCEQAEREAEVRDAQARRQAAADRLTQLGVQMRAHDEETARLTAEHEELERELTEKNPADLRERLHQKISEKKRIQDECQQMSRDIEKLTSEMEQEQRNGSALQDRKTQLEQEIERRKQESAALERKVYDAEQELSVLKSDSIQQSMQKKQARLHLLREISDELRRDSEIFRDAAGQSEGWKFSQALQGKLGAVEHTLHEVQEQIKRYGDGLGEEVLR